MPSCMSTVCISLIWECRPSRGIGTPNSKLPATNITTACSWGTIASCLRLKMRFSTYAYSCIHVYVQFSISKLHLDPLLLSARCIRSLVKTCIIKEIIHGPLSSLKALVFPTKKNKKQNSTCTNHTFPRPQAPLMSFPHFSANPFPAANPHLRSQVA